MVTAVRNAPQVTSMDLLDATNLIQARDALKPMAEARASSSTTCPFSCAPPSKPCARSPRPTPRSRTMRCVLKHEFNIGIATAVPGGLIVPVVKQAERADAAGARTEIERVVTAARERRSTPADLSGGTFTITSFGGLPGSPLFATPILNYPEVAILGIGRIDWQPRVVDGQVVPRECVGHLVHVRPPRAGR